MENQTLTQLRSAISDMDCMSQSGVSSIAAITKLAPAALENPMTCNDIDSIAAALESIRSTAMDVENCINATAEGVGCHYVDAAQRRRWEAKREAESKKVKLSHGL